ncbi:MAG: sigma-54 dependent transcriptional regulator [Thermodesulfovibrionales bacterium]
MKQRILIVDDDPSTRFGFSAYLSKAGYEIDEASCLAEAKEAVSSKRIGAVLLDLKLPDGNGIDWIPGLRENYPDVAIVVITGSGDVPVAVDAMRRGADNFLTKPVNMSELDVFLRKSLELGKLRRKNISYNRLMKKEEPFFGESSLMRSNFELASLAASNDSPVLIIGETGTGKGVLASWIHDNSDRSSEAFVEVNCSSLRGELLASELFGHAKGAFTSAVEDRQGLVDIADRGTLMLDEIGDMDPGVQTQFLKVIEEKTYRRLGEVKVRRSEFRLICATNHDLFREAEDGKFRSDLYYRINVFPVILPPLRERKEDIPGLISHLLLKLGPPDQEMSLDTLEFLKSYSWPGNVRELKNVLERALILAKGESLELSHFPGLRGPDDRSVQKGPAKNLIKVEEKHINDIIDRFGGDTKRAAEELGISRATLYRKLKKYKETG